MLLNSRIGILLLFLFGFPVTALAAPKHALTLDDAPKYGPDYAHFDYANPKAPKGGEIKMSAIGTFDSLNPFIIKGSSAAGIGAVFDSLAEGSSDEPFTEYGLLAETMEVAPDNTWVIFNLRQQARFQNGDPVTADDVVFSFETLVSKGHPHYQSYYADIKNAEALHPSRVRFNFKHGNNPELAIITGQLSVFSKKYWQDKDFEKTTLEQPLGSGPYKVVAIDPGRSITYELDDNYWGKDLPINKGRHNFKKIRYDYYRDRNIALEAFKAGEFDFKTENTSKLWATGYDGPGLANGLLKKEEIRHEIPTGMQGYVFNLRRELFKDKRVRQAIALLFDFEWTNKNLFYDAYARTSSYFSNSVLASTGLPSAEELAILEPYRGKIPDEVFTQEFKPSVTDGKGNIRSQLRQALGLLKAAGWEIDSSSKKLVHKTNKQVFNFEIMLSQPAFERITLPYKENLQRLGMEVRVRTVDSAQYEKRLEDFDFDMVVHTFGQSLSPGNEQRNFWTSEYAGINASANVAGIADPVIDELVEKLINAKGRQNLINHTRTLDRILLWGYYLVPHWHIRHHRVAYWDKFSRPQITPKYSLGFDTWWVDAGKEQALQKNKNKLQ